MENLEKFWNEFGRIKPPPPPPIQMRNYSEFIEFIANLQPDKAAIEKITMAFEQYYNTCNKASEDLMGVINGFKKSFK
jgi:hypothetical protein